MVLELAPKQQHWVFCFCSRGVNFDTILLCLSVEMMDSACKGTRKAEKSVLYDHLPLPLNEDDYLRVCRIPKKKVG